MNLVTKSAIDFTASAVLASGKIVDDFCLSKHIKDKYAVLFFYPLDFTLGHKNVEYIRTNEGQLIQNCKLDVEINYK